MLALEKKADKNAHGLVGGGGGGAGGGFTWRFSRLPLALISLEGDGNIISLPTFRL